MAIVTYTKRDVEALVERLNNRANSALCEQMPSMRKDIKAICMIMSTMLAAFGPVGTLNIDMKVKDNDDIGIGPNLIQ